jgi:hypothetical protein
MVAVPLDDAAAIALVQLGAPSQEILTVNIVIEEKPLNRWRDVTPRDVSNRFSCL